MKFNERKVAQMAAFFLGQSQEWKMPHLKLMALLYLSDREAVRAFGWTISGNSLKLMGLLYLSDREAVRAFGWTISGNSLISMLHGPILSHTLNLMDGDVESQTGSWEEWISSDKENHELSLRQPLDADALDELAPAEIEVLKAIWDKFGAMDKLEIRNWTRRHCAEWKDPKGSSFPIQYDALARAVGFDDASAKVVAAQIQDEQKIDCLFAAKNGDCNER